MGVRGFRRGIVAGSKTLLCAYKGVRKEGVKVSVMEMMDEEEYRDRGM